MSKVELIQRLQDSSAVKFREKRAERLPLSALQVVDESQVVEVGYAEREMYTLSATFEATFHRLPREADIVRHGRREELTRIIADTVYGDVCREVRKLGYLLAEIDDVELRRAIERVIANVTEMTSP